MSNIINIEWITTNWDVVLDLAIAHVGLAVPAILGTFILAIPIGWLAHRAGQSRRWRPARASIILLTGVLFGIPSLALFVLLPVILGTSILSPLNVVIALLIYGVALQTRVVAEGFDANDNRATEAADALGYSRARRFWAVDLPLAGPSILAGMRVVSASTISLVSVGTLIGVGSLGDLLTAGFQRNFPTQILVGILATVALAILFDLALVLVGRLVMPWRTKAGL
ncbi:ABC transporter permease [Corynebacterium heidelbergense]|uniref:ABC transporter permease n=1 Tax=Corynebacterium heidelbergense TaxID=2055947 RepID=UPI001EE69A07|nr:ABC transporter permease subunit [Corynebacterium heidelbergense]